MLKKSILYQKNKQIDTKQTQTTTKENETKQKNSNKMKNKLLRSIISLLGEQGTDNSQTICSLHLSPSIFCQES